MARTEKNFLKKSWQDKIRKIKESPDDEKLWYISLLPDKDQGKLAKEAGIEQLFAANKGLSTGAKPGKFTRGKKESTVNKPTVSTETKEYMDTLRAEALKGLPGLLQQLRTPYQSPLTQQFESMFGHLQNPILQGLINPQAQNMPRGALFPSEIEQEYMQSPQYQQQQQEQNPLMGLMSALGQNVYKHQVVPWLQRPETPQELYDYAQEGIPQAYEYAMGSRPIQALSSLYNSTPGYIARGALYGAATAPQTLYESGKAFGNIGKDKLSNLMSYLGSYMPGRGQQQPQQ